MNLFHDLPAPMEEELSEVLARGEGVRVERIVSWGQASPEGFWYDQPDHEWVALLTGGAGLRFAEGNRLVSLAPGDTMAIPPHVRHRVEWTDPGQATVWLAVFYR